MYQLVYGGEILIQTEEIELVIAKINSFAIEKNKSPNPNEPISIRFKKVSDASIHVHINDDEIEFLRLSCKDVNFFISEYAKTNFEKPKKITLE
jgi:hypothetical protein